MAKKVNINKDKEKYHFDEYANSFVMNNDMPFDSKIHPQLRHLHKDASFLVCSVCGHRSTSGEINQDCQVPAFNGKKCPGLMMGKRI